jgi:parallel beta helix pectate lyase-like protein
MKPRFLWRVLTVVAVVASGFALATAQASARGPSPTGGTVSGGAIDPANAVINLTQLFALGEVDISTLGVSDAELLTVGPTSTASGGGNLLIVGNDPARCPNADYPTIQSAVTAAQPGAAIKVCPGTYIEQVAIPAGKDGLRLFSEGAFQAVIKAPPLMTGREAIVEVNGAQDVTIRHFTITGPGGGGCNSIRYGVFVGNGGSALVTDNHITEIHDTPFSGCQNGLGVALGRGIPPDGPTVGTGTVVHNLIDRYQKGGVLVDGQNSSGEVAYNEVVGAGATPIIAQNGIQSSRQASADIHHNKVSMNNYALPGTDSTGILLFTQNNVGTSVHHNNTYLNDDGIYLFDAMSNEVSHNSSSQNDFDGVIADVPTSNNTISFNRLLNNGLFDCEDDSPPGAGSPPSTSNFWINDHGNTENKTGLCKRTGP